jgi:thiamine kinase-like enzyme
VRRLKTPLIALRSALAAADHALACHELVALPDKGLAHDHVRIVGSGWLARMPKQSQMGLDAASNLAYQRACFERAFPSGATPGLHSVLPPSADLPRGALLVQEIEGRSARLPQDLTAIATALAALHALPVPAPSGRAPLLATADPLADLVAEISAQGQHLASARLQPAAANAVERALQQLAGSCQQVDRPPCHLIAFDGHPGNFIVRPEGSAVLVDLEKCRYSYPGLDLAHATLYTSTTWDVDSHAVLTETDIVGAYDSWERAMGAAAGHAAAWHVTLRRAMWLWSVTWCAKWRVLSAERGRPSGDGEDWSAERSDASLVDHVRERVDHYLSAAVVERVVQELASLERVLAS